MKLGDLVIRISTNTIGIVTGVSKGTLFGGATRVVTFYCPKYKTTIKVVGSQLKKVNP